MVDRLVVLCEHVFVRTYSYTVAEHDPDRPWILVGEIRRLTVQLEDDEGFFEWAASNWPRDRFKVELDPWQLARAGR